VVDPSSGPVAVFFLARPAELPLLDIWFNTETDVRPSGPGRGHAGRQGFECAHGASLGVFPAPVSSDQPELTRIFAVPQLTCPTSRVMSAGGPGLIARVHSRLAVACPWRSSFDEFGMID